jgi:hypothetical protein
MTAASPARKRATMGAHGIAAGSHDRRSLDSVTTVMVIVSSCALTPGLRHRACGVARRRRG